MTSLARCATEAAASFPSRVTILRKDMNARFVRFATVGMMQMHYFEKVPRELKTRAVLLSRPGNSVGRCARGTRRAVEPLWASREPVRPQAQVPRKRKRRGSDGMVQTHHGDSGAACYSFLRSEEPPEPGFGRRGELMRIMVATDGSRG